MARVKDEKVIDAIKPYLKEGEELKHWAIGVFWPRALAILIPVLVLVGLLWVFLLIPIGAPLYAKYGPVDPRPLLMMMLLMSPWIIGFGVSVTLLQRNYMIGVTENRFIALRYKGKLKVQEATDYSLGNVPPSQVSSGSLNTTIKIDDPARPFSVKCHRAVMPDNRYHAESIGEALSSGSRRSPTA